MRLVSWLSELGKDDGPLAGGKGANLGEMLRISIVLRVSVATHW